MPRALSRSCVSAACATVLLAGSPILAHEPHAPLVPTDRADGRETGFQYAAALQSPADDGGMRYDFNTWFWMVGMTGDVGARGRNADVDATFIDMVENSDSLAAFSARLEVGKGDWAGYIDGIYAKLGVDDQTGRLGLAEVDVEFTMVVLDFGVMYRVGVWEPTGDAANNRRQTTLDLYAGGRYTDLELELSPANTPSASRSESWVDPIIGAKLVLPIAEQWRLQANADVGGFGAASDLTWSVTGVFGYDFTLFDLPATFFAGYRAIGQDYSDGSGSDEFIWDVVLHGPIIGFSLKF